MEEIIITQLPPSSNISVSREKLGICYMLIGVGLIGLPTVFICLKLFMNSFTFHSTSIRDNGQTSFMEACPDEGSLNTLVIFLTTDLSNILLHSCGSFFLEYLPAMAACLMILLFSICAAYVGLLNLRIIHPLS